MGLIGGSLGYRVLRAIAPRQAGAQSAPTLPDAQSILLRYYGDDFFAGLSDKTVIDFGCGEGREAVAMAEHCPTARVIGTDIQAARLDKGRALAAAKGVASRCRFMAAVAEPADLIVSKDAFEHFDRPDAVLATMHSLLKPGGKVLAAFGPTWFHPYGGHLFSVFPWSHLMFTERAQIRWRSDFKRDGATRFCEVEGGLNQMTIRHFEQLVQESPLQLDWLQTVPIKGLALLKAKGLREFGSSLVRCQLRRD